MHWATSCVCGCGDLFTLVPGPVDCQEAENRSGSTAELTGSNGGVFSWQAWDWKSVRVCVCVTDYCLSCQSNSATVTPVTSVDSRYFTCSWFPHGLSLSLSLSLSVRSLVFSPPFTLCVLFIRFLCLSVSYHGSCKSHSFTLLFSGFLMRLRGVPLFVSIRHVISLFSTPFFHSLSLCLSLFSQKHTLICPTEIAVSLDRGPHSLHRPGLVQVNHTHTHTHTHTERHTDRHIYRQIYIYMRTHKKRYRQTFMYRHISHLTDIETFACSSTHRQELNHHTDTNTWTCYASH